MFIRSAWYVAAWSDDLSNGPLARRICDEPVVLYRAADGTVAALADYCAHRAAPLSVGRVVESGLQCGYHGMIFDGTGACVHIPGQVHVPGKAAVRSYPIAEQNGLIWIWMGDPAQADRSTIVQYPFHDDPVNWPHRHTTDEIAADAMLVIDNLMDLTHLGYVHESTIGGNPAAHVDAIMDTVPTENGLRFTRWMLDVKTPPTHALIVPSLAPRVDRWQEFEFIAPATIRQWSGAVSAGTGAYDRGQRDGGFSIRIFHCATPKTATSCTYFWSTAIGYSQDDPQAVIDAFDQVAYVVKEDIAIMELQQARMSEIAEANLVNIVADGARVQMRRVVERMLAQEAPQLIG
jgi:phenylpropionate dioxygenase-like ring-hydroxylating dioxygenase large terminal subunit